MAGMMMGLGCARVCVPVGPAGSCSVSSSRAQAGGSGVRVGVQAAPAPAPLRLRRRATATRASLANGDTYTVELRKPIGLRFAKGGDGGVYVDGIVPGGEADLDGQIKVGHKVVETSAVFGDEMWPAAEYGRTLYTIRTRGGDVTLKMAVSDGPPAPGSPEDEKFKAERAGGNYGQATAQKQYENYLRRTETEKERRTYIDEGLRLYGAGKYADAIIKFEAVIGLKPDYKEQTVSLYNLACCYAQTGALDAGLESLGMCMEAGFDEFGKIRKDNDLAPLRESPKFKALIDKYDEPILNENAIKLIKSFFGKK